MFTGYALDHTGDTYRMWEPRKMSRVHETYNIIWLKRMCCSKPMIEHDFVVIYDNVEVSIPLYKGGESNI
jgi:hypothetical protein